MMLVGSSPPFEPFRFGGPYLVGSILHAVIARRYSLYQYHVSNLYRCLKHQAL